MPIPQANFSGAWRAVRYVYAGPMALLLAAAIGGLITFYQCSFLAFMLIILLLPAAVVIEQAGLRKKGI